MDRLTAYEQDPSEATARALARVAAARTTLGLAEPVPATLADEHLVAYDDEYLAALTVRIHGLRCDLADAESRDDLASRAAADALRAILARLTR